jgi:hypothetical protein
MTDYTKTFPLTVVKCQCTGFVCSVYENIGTSCAYFQHCPSCGARWPETEKVKNAEELAEAQRITAKEVEA